MAGEKNRLRLISALAVGLVLGGCASFNHLSNEVSTFGAWPAERKPATYVFDRLPSQETQPEQQQRLEDSARDALQQAGFTAAADPKDAEYLMQVGARVVTDDPWVNDPLFWRGGLRYGYPGYGWGGRFGRPGWRSVGWGPGWGLYDIPPNYDREVALVIRDRKTGQVLYEAHANNNGPSAGIDYLLPAMFDAAMKDFPAVSPNPHNVTVELTRKQG